MEGALARDHLVEHGAEAKNVRAVVERLTAFGFDSVVELLSGLVLLGRLSVEARGAELGRTVRNVLVWSLGLVVAAFAVTYFMFFRT